MDPFALFGFALRRLIRRWQHWADPPDDGREGRLLREEAAARGPRKPARPLGMIAEARGAHGYARAESDERMVKVLIEPTDRPSQFTSFPLAGAIVSARFEVSASGWLLLVLRSQRGEGFVLFATTPTLKRVVLREPLPGGEATHRFAPDERRLVMALPLAGNPWVEERLERAERSALHLGYLHAYDLDSGRDTIHQVRVWFAAQRRFDWTPRFRLVDHHVERLTLEVPWGTVELPLPLPTLIELDVPDANVNARS